MKFSTKATYGLRAMVNLARSQKRLKTARLIASEEQISPKYLERIFGILGKNNLVEGIKGIKGGYRLAKDPDEISAKDIIESLDGSIVKAHCYRCQCSKTSECSSSRVWINLKKALSQTLENTKLSNLIR